MSYPSLAVIAAAVMLSSCASAVPPNPVRTPSPVPSHAPVEGTSSQILSEITTLDGQAAAIDARAPRDISSVPEQQPQAYRVDGRVQRIDSIRDLSREHVSGDAFYFTPTGQLFKATVTDVDKKYDSAGRLTTVTDGTMNYYFTNGAFLAATAAHGWPITSDPAERERVLTAAQAAFKRAGAEPASSM